MDLWEPKHDLQSSCLIGYVMYVKFVLDSFPWFYMKSEKEKLPVFEPASRQSNTWKIIISIKSDIYIKEIFG